MSSKQTCSDCGKECSGHLPFGLCEACALKAAGTGRAIVPSVGDVDQTVRRFGNFVLGQLIGRGGMGVVYEATQDRPQRLVALKMILDSVADSPSVVSRFALEADTAASLEHPNIVPIYEIGEFDGRPFIAMKRIGGENLRRKIASGELCLPKGRDRRRPEQRQRMADIARLIVTIARAVHYAHLHGVVHRDLKPANILVDAEGQPHLTDFGLAKRFGDRSNPSAMALTGSGSLVGTPDYMSPEQADGRTITPASDIYSLGAILFEMLTGEPPFRASTLRETLRLVVEREASAPSSRYRGIDADLDTICLKCLEKNPEARYATAEALANDLQRWIDGKPIVAHRSRYVGRTIRWVRRNPIGAGLILSLCLCLVISLALLEMRIRKARQLADERTWVQERIAQHITQAWDNPATDFISIEPRDLAALGDRTINAGSHPLELTYAVRLPFDPINTAVKYSRFLGEMEKHMSRILKRPVTFTLQLHKHSSWEIAVRKGVDLQQMTFLSLKRLKELEPGIQVVAKEVFERDFNIHGATIFARAGSGITNLAQLRGHRIAFAHTNSVTSTIAKLELAASNICAGMFQICTNLDPPFRTLKLERKMSGAELDEDSFAHQEVMAKVLSGEYDAGVATYRRFERVTGGGTNKTIVLLHRFLKTPDVCVARADLPKEIVLALRQCLLEFRNKEILGATQSSMRNGFAPVTDTEIHEFDRRLEKYLPLFENCSEGTGVRNPTNAPVRR